MTLPFAKRISLRFLISVAVWCIAAFPLIAQTTSILSSPIERQGIHSSDQGIKLVFTEPLIETSKPIYDALQKNNDLQLFIVDVNVIKRTKFFLNEYTIVYGIDTMH